MTTYVVTRPGRELLFTVVSQDEKYKAKVLNLSFSQLLVRKSVLLKGKVTLLFYFSFCALWSQVCIDVIVQRLGDAAAAGLFEVLTIALGGQTLTASLYALPVYNKSFLLSDNSSCMSINSP